MRVVVEARGEGYAVFGDLGITQLAADKKFGS